MKVRTIDYEADGLQLTGTLAVPDTPGPHPAVLIGHEGPDSTMFNATGRARSRSSDTSVSHWTITVNSARLLNATQ